jgi:hypothetical protein
MINLLFSYSHKDEDLRNELEKHLSILKRNGIIDAWHDRRIEAGSDFSASISEHLKKANIILLLVSADFLSSDYCYDLEMKEALRMHAQNQAVVIPVILRPCAWQRSPFAKLLALPKDGKAVTKFPTLDDGFLEVTNGITAVLDRLSLKSEPKSISNDAKPGTQTLKPRSSNLAITREFSDHEKDKFLKDSFNYIVNFFEGSLQELESRNPQVRSMTERVDSKTFTASLYIDGKIRSECMIFLGSAMSTKGISYSNNISTTKNSLNESLNVVDDGYALMLKPFGMPMFGLNKDKALTNEGAAEYYWQMFIQRLQGR